MALCHQCLLSLSPFISPPTARVSQWGPLLLSGGDPSGRAWVAEVQTHGDQSQGERAEREMLRDAPGPLRTAPGRQPAVLCRVWPLPCSPSLLSFPSPPPPALPASAGGGGNFPSPKQVPTHMRPPALCGVWPLPCGPPPLPSPPPPPPAPPASGGGGGATFPPPSRCPPTCSLRALRGSPYHPLRSS